MHDYFPWGTIQSRESHLDERRGGKWELTRKIQIYKRRMRVIRPIGSDSYLCINICAAGSI